MNAPRIFVTVGTQLPFDRLIAAVLDWAKHDGSVFRQIDIQYGATKLEMPQNPKIRHTDFMSPADYQRCFEDADLIISHAGMGTIMQAAKLEKPVVIMPRRASYGEHRNDHQLGTARQMMQMENVYEALIVQDLPVAIFEALSFRYAPGQEMHFSENRKDLISFVHDFIQQEIRGD